DQAHHSDNLESEFARCFDGLNRRCARSTDIVHDHDARALLAEAFDALSGAVLLFGLTHKEALQLAADYSDGDHDRVGAQGEPADRLRLPAALPDFFEEHFARQPRALRVERGGAAIDVVIAGRSG